MQCPSSALTHIYLADLIKDLLIYVWTNKAPFFVLCGEKTTCILLLSKVTS